MVESADVLIVEASYPSVGIGIEMQLAEGSDTPIVLAFKETDDHRAAPIRYENPDHSEHDLQIGEGFVTLMALGMPSIYKIVRYAEYPEGQTAVIEAVRMLDSPSRA